MKHIIWFVVAVIPALQAPQTPAAASIHGFVTRLETQEPIPRADVVLIRTGGALDQSRTAVTDNSGRFEFTTVESGEYRIFVRRDGYAPAEYGQSGVNLPGTPIAATAGQRVDNIIVPLTPTSVISGRIFNEYGEPVSNVSVRALKAAYPAFERVLETVQSAQTNDLGEYRLFGLLPGRYFVGAVPPKPAHVENDSFISPTPPTENRPAGRMTMPIGAAMAAGLVSADLLRGEMIIPTYFPGTPDAAAASHVDLQPGIEMRGTDFSVLRIRPTHIRGQVINGATGLPAWNANVALWPRQPRSAGVSALASTSSSESGQFDLRNLVPGAYVLIARLSEGRNQSAFSAYLPLDLGLADVENVTLVLQPSFTVSGRLRIEDTLPGQMDPRLQNIRVALRPLTPVAPPPLAAINPDGTFAFVGLNSGDYRIEAQAVPEGSYMKAARLGGEDVLNGLRLQLAPADPLELLLSPNSGTLDVSVVDDAQNPARNVRVVLVPDAARRIRRQLFRTGFTNAMGRLLIEGIAPGDYTVYAWSNAETDAWMDPEFLRMYESQGRYVRIDERSVQSASVRVIR